MCGRTGKDLNTRTMFEGGGEAEYATGSARAMIEDGGEAENATGPARNRSYKLAFGAAADYVA